MTLGKRKRDDCEHGIPSTKHQTMKSKSHQSGSSYNVNSYSSISVPVPPPSSSPLFLLPAELRAQIWSHAYGHHTIHVALLSLNKLAEASHNDLLYTICQQPNYEITFRFPPRVSKQFYLEATAALYETSTFSFNESHTFRAFALSKHTRVRQVQHISIPHLSQHWTDALVSSLVGRLTGLRGVHLTHDHSRCNPVRPLPNARDASWRDYWRMVRAFQQHELEKQRTRFELVVTNVYGSPWNPQACTRERLRHGMPEHEDVVELERKFTEGLLEFTPRRVSRRCARS